MKGDIKRRVARRLRIIEGQVRGLSGMVEKEAYCIDIITQAQAAKEALSSVEDLMLENHLATHVIEQMKDGKHAKAVREVVSVYRLSKRK